MISFHKHNVTGKERFVCGIGAHMPYLFFYFFVINGYCFVVVVVVKEKFYQGKKNVF